MGWGMAPVGNHLLGGGNDLASRAGNEKQPHVGNEKTSLRVGNEPAFRQLDGFSRGSISHSLGASKPLDTFPSLSQLPSTEAYGLGNQVSQNQNRSVSKWSIPRIM